MDPKEYKIFHESFMQNNNGTTAFNTFLTILPTFFTTSLYTIGVASSTITISSIPIQFVIEFCILILPLIGTLTILNEFILEINVALLVLFIPTVGFLLKDKLHTELFIQIPTKPIQYLTVTRSIISFLTCICILAVDFQCFPRGLAKTETFGYGLMDTGVGFYVLTNGVVSTEARKKSNEKLTLAKMKKIFLSTSPLIVLGVVRFFLVNEIDYQQHVSEYGVHWNFFITLAAVKLFGSIICEILPSPKYAHFASITIMCLHEMALQLGLSQYVMSHVERNTFINANREGIISIPGYIALYLVSVYVGNMLQSEDKQYIRPRELLKLIGKIMFLGIFCWKMIFVCDNMFGSSRRLANMGYCFWILALAFSMFSLLMLLEIIVLFLKFNQQSPSNTNTDTINNKNDTKDEMDHTKYTPLIYEAMTYNGLAFFLIANLMTGAINLMFQTMLMSQTASLIIITYYQFTIMLVMVFLYVNKIRLKFW